MIAVDKVREGTETGMQPLYLARIEDLRRGDLVKVDCAACHHVADRRELSGDVGCGDE